MKKHTNKKGYIIIVFTVIIMLLLFTINLNRSPETIIQKYVKEESTFEIVDVKNVQDYNIYLLKVNGINSIIALNEDNEVVDYIPPAFFSTGGDRGEDIHVNRLYLDNDVYVIVSLNPDLHTIVFEGNNIEYTETVTTAPYFTIIDPYLELKLNVDSNRVEFEYYFLDYNNLEIR